MSLFSSREWWATRLGGDREEFDQSSLCAANIDNNASGASEQAAAPMHGCMHACMRPATCTLQRPLPQTRRMMTHAVRMRAPCAPMQPSS